MSNSLGRGSNAAGRRDLDSGRGRFLGIAPEALSVFDKSAEGARVYSVDEILRESGDIYDFAPNQIRKLQNILEQKGYHIQREK